MSLLPSQNIITVSLYEFIDCATECVRERFAQKSFAVYMDTENILLNTFCGKARDELARELQTVTDHFHDDVDVKRLTIIQLSMLSSTCSATIISHNPAVFRI